jgi:hypothetical protein
MWFASGAYAVAASTVHVVEFSRPNVSVAMTLMKFMPKPSDTLRWNAPVPALNVAVPLLMRTDWIANASLTRTGMLTVPGEACTMYASDAVAGASKRMHSIVGPAVSTATCSVALSGTLPCVGELTVAVSW